MDRVAQTRKNSVLQVLHGTQKRERNHGDSHVAEPGQKGGGKRIGATKSQPFISKRPASTSQLISLVRPGAHPYISAVAALLTPPKERLQLRGVSKKRVAPDLLAFRNNGVCYSPQIVFPSQEGRMGSHAPGCRSQADDRLHGCPCQRVRR